MSIDQEIEQRRNEQTGEDDRANLVSEIERLKLYIRDYGSSVSAKLLAIEEEMGQLEEENSRLVLVKRSVSAERDTCINLLCQLAASRGLKVGASPENRVVVDLPSGQVSWDVNPSEAHLFAWLPPYPDAPGSIEELTIEENYRRVMNPGI